jgi:hypothetical protein
MMMWRSAVRQHHGSSRESAENLDNRDRPGGLGGSIEKAANPDIV